MYCATLREAVHYGMKDSTGLVVICGPAGSGKSKLLREICRDMPTEQWQSVDGDDLGHLEPTDFWRLPRKVVTSNQPSIQLLHMATMVVETACENKRYIAKITKSRLCHEVQGNIYDVTQS